MERIKEIAVLVAESIAGLCKKTVSNKHLKHYTPLVVVTIVAVMTLITCVSGQPKEPDPEPEPPAVIVTPPPSTPPVVTTPPSPSPEPDPEPEPEPEPDTGFRNPLTGLQTEEDISTRRPFAIVVNNHKNAMPQVGISKADIIYEYLVEGESTRMLALYQDITDIGVIGSIRSARHYTVDLAQSYDAIFMFAGWSPQAEAALKTRKLDYFDETHDRGSEMYYRDQDRRLNKGSEHSLMLSSNRINEHLPKYNLRMEIEEGYERALSFAPDRVPDDGLPDDGLPDDGLPNDGLPAVETPAIETPASEIPAIGPTAGGEAALEFIVRFGPNSKTTGFSFSDETGLYKLRQHGSAYIDGGNNEQVAVTNVLILKMTTAGIRGDTEGRLDITTLGSGEGYFVNGGAYIDIRWSRESETSQFRYTLTDGSELLLGRGKTYICLIRTNGSVDFA